MENDAECYMEVSAGGGDNLRANKPPKKPSHPSLDALDEILFFTINMAIRIEVTNNNIVISTPKPTSFLAVYLGVLYLE